MYNLTSIRVVPVHHNYNNNHVMNTMVIIVGKHNKIKNLNEENDVG